MRRCESRIWASMLVLATSAFPECRASEPKGTYESPRLTKLAAALHNGDKHALEGFWKEVQGKAPLVEPVPDDPEHSRVTFLYRGDGKTTGVALRGGLPTSADFNR